jgi:group II intron reverse transcriptase/maturase
MLSERGKNKKPLQRIYRLLFNVELWLLAYQNIYANKGAMTKGATDETADGMSTKKIERIIEKLRSETYRWTPVRRVYKAKSNGKQRPLGLPTWSDKLLQEVIRLILDAYYDCQFSEHSHGFRENKGCKTALESLTHYKRGWKSTKWFLEGDITRCFESLDHQILLQILGEQIDDNRFLRLIANYLCCGFLEEWRYNKTLSGCPQGGILSPLLSNVYMNKFDQYVENTLIPRYTTGKKRARNKEYRSIDRQKYEHRKKQNWAEAKEFEKLAQRLPSVDPLDPNFRRLYFCRYADDARPEVPASNTVGARTCGGLSLARQQRKVSTTQSVTLTSSGLPQRETTRGTIAYPRSRKLANHLPTTERQDVRCRQGIKLNCFLGSPKRDSVLDGIRWLHLPPDRADM